MANVYNSNPIVLDTDIATGWRANQTLNTATLPANNQQFSGAVKAQWGVRPTKIILESNGTTVAGTVSLVDPNDSTVTLWSAAVAAAAGAAGTKLITEDFGDNYPSWRDFKVTGLTATVTKIYIWYRT